MSPVLGEDNVYPVMMNSSGIEMVKDFTYLEKSLLIIAAILRRLVKPLVV